jgi:5-carboxymethyl-2-hydroxymuconate isomerase
MILQPRLHRRKIEMPHCIFEYSANIADDPDWPQIIGKIHEGLVTTGQFVANDIKSRVIRHDNYRIGDGAPNQSFVTLNLQILDGRSDEFKCEITRMALEVLLAAFKKSRTEQKCSITVQTSEIHGASYRRSVSY